MRHSNQTSRVGFLSSKLPPPPCAVLLVDFLWFLPFSSDFITPRPRAPRWRSVKDTGCWVCQGWGSVSGPETESRRAEFNSVRSDKVSRSDTLQTFAGCQTICQTPCGGILLGSRWPVHGSCTVEGCSRRGNSEERWRSWAVEGANVDGHDIIELYIYIIIYIYIYMFFCGDSWVAVVQRLWFCRDFVCCFLRGVAEALEHASEKHGRGWSS